MGLSAWLIVVDGRLPCALQVVACHLQSVSYLNTCQAFNPGSEPVASHAQYITNKRGRAVGEAMDALLERRPARRVRITRHDTVITRTSTDAQAIADPFIARAIAYACAHLVERPTLAKLAKAAGCSKTLLNLHARRALGHTISDELTRHQLNAAIERLSNTDRTVEEIAQACGFCSASHLGLRLKAATGHTPGHYRHRRTNAYA